MSDVVSRRGVLAGAAALGTLAVTGCGGSDDSDSGTPAGTTTSPATPSSSASASAVAAPLAKLADIPVGSAVSAKSAGKDIIVARPTTTSAVAFDAKCTHKGCSVKPSGAELQCPCHGSRFAAATGKVLKGPAEAPLNAFPVKVTGGNVTTA